HEGPETIALADFLELMEQASDIALRFERAGERPHALHELWGDLLLPLFNELASSANRSKSRVEHADVLRGRALPQKLGFLDRLPHETLGGCDPRAMARLDREEGDRAAENRRRGEDADDAGQTPRLALARRPHTRLGGLEPCLARTLLERVEVLRHRLGNAGSARWSRGRIGLETRDRERDQVDVRAGRPEPRTRVVEIRSSRATCDVPRIVAAV